MFSDGTFGRRCADLLLDSEIPLDAIICMATPPKMTESVPAGDSAEAEAASESEPEPELEPEWLQVVVPRGLPLHCRANS